MALLRTWSFLQRDLQNSFRTMTKYASSNERTTGAQVESVPKCQNQQSKEDLQYGLDYLLISYPTLVGR
jgi:hypothetical protein